MSKRQASRAASVRPVKVKPGAQVSVVITCYNYASYLPEAVNSVLGQEGVDVKVIIVDDLSSDDSLQVARELEGSDSRVSVIANPINVGAPAAFNIGLAAAEGEYLVRLDADDLLTPGSLARSVAVMQTLPDVGLVYGRPLHFSGSELPPARTSPTSWTVWRGPEWLATRCEDGSNVITSPEVLMRRALLTELGGMRDLAHAHDMELWLRISAHADVAYISGADQAWHREHSASLSRLAEPPLVILTELRSAFTELFASLGDSYPRAAALRAASSRAVANQAIERIYTFLDRGSRTELVEQLRTFAIETDPTIVSTAEWTRLERSFRRELPIPVARLIGLPGRFKRRMKTNIRARRWQATGIYERLLLSPIG